MYQSYHLQHLNERYERLYYFKRYILTILMIWKPTSKICILKYFIQSMH